MSHSVIKKVMLVILAVTYLVFLAEDFFYLDPVYATVTSEKIDYRAPVDGILETIAVKSGDPIAIGNPLFEIKRFAIESDDQKDARRRVDDVASEIRALDTVRIDLEERLNFAATSSNGQQDPIVSISTEEQGNAKYIEQKLLNLQELALMAKERLAIERDRYSAATEKEKNSRQSIVRSAQSGRAVTHLLVSGSTVSIGDPLISVLNCQALSIDLFFNEADAARTHIDETVKFSLSGSSQMWSALIADRPINVELLDTRLKYNLPLLPRGHWYRVRAIPEEAFVSMANQLPDCLVGRQIIASLPRRSPPSFFRTLFQ